MLTGVRPQAHSVGTLPWAGPDNPGGTTRDANPDHQNRLQVDFGAIVSRRDRILWRQYVYRGNRHGIGTIRNLLVEFQRAGVRPGLL